MLVAFYFSLFFSLLFSHLSQSLSFSLSFSLSHARTHTMLFRETLSEKNSLVDMFSMDDGLGR